MYLHTSQLPGWLWSCPSEVSCECRQVGSSTLLMHMLVSPKAQTYLIHALLCSIKMHHVTQSDCADCQLQAFAFTCRVARTRCRAILECARLAWAMCLGRPTLASCSTICLCSRWESWTRSALYPTQRLSVRLAMCDAYVVAAMPWTGMLSLLCLSCLVMRCCNTTDSSCVCVRTA